MELRLVQVVINRLASDGIAKRNFSMLLVVHKTLTSAVVESGLAAFSLQLREAQIPHFSGTFQRHLGVMLGEDLVVLRWDHLVLAFNTTQAGEEQVFNSRKINSHGSCPPYEMPVGPAPLLRSHSLLNPTTT